MKLQGLDQLAVYRRKKRKPNKGKASQEAQAALKILLGTTNPLAELPSAELAIVASDEADPPYSCDVVGAHRTRSGVVRVAVIWHEDGEDDTCEWIPINQLVDCSPGEI